MKIKIKKKFFVTEIKQKIKIIKKIYKERERDNFKEYFFLFNFLKLKKKYSRIFEQK